MTSSHPEDRIRLSIELALTAKDTQRQETQDAEARALGMSGAEIDAARRGRSFDAKTSIAMALAIASASGSSELAAERAKAQKAGFSEDECRLIEEFARKYTAQAAKHG